MTDPLSRALAQQPSGPNTNGLRIGVVVNGKPTLQGGVLENVGYLNGYAPVEGHAVALLQQDGMWLCLGSVGGGGTIPFPIGGIFMSEDPTDPATIFGGVWQQIQDRFLLAAGATFVAGATGGAATSNALIAHVHTGPAHVHTSPYDADGGSGTTRNTVHVGGGASTGTINTGSAGTGNTGSAGSGTSFSIMPPYLVVYVWKRIA